MNRIPKLFWVLVLSSLLAMAVLSFFIVKQGEMVLDQVQKITEAGEAESLNRAEDDIKGMNFITGEQRLGLYTLLAGRFSQIGNQSRMYEVFESILKMDSENAEVLNNLSYEWAKQGINLEQAEEYSRKAVALAGKKISGQKPTGMSRERWENIIRMERGNYLDTYGWVLYQKGKYNSALRELQKAFKLAEDPTIQYHLALALYRTGNLDGAIENLAASLAGRLEDPAKTRADLEAIYKERYKTLKGLDKMLQLAAEKALARQQAEDEADAAKIVGQPAPDFSLPDLDDQFYRLSQFRDQVVILDFWATWCGPCKLAMPLIDKVHLEYREKGLVVLGINLEGRDKNQRVKQFIQESGHQFVILQGGMMGVGVDQVYGVTGIPTTFVIDKQGIIRYRHIGYRENLDQMLAREVEELLKQ
ncbi:MAG: redoxin domain-containing protein [Candidatus Edwardsbacteria bacterium]|nr:redoxin domain-containing protein [Candidatus Edwardsbacteria bacterium]MBU1577583.1 redoxin domain-containing protein [Candidatus Edwardsbacteria bacterium]MBU2463404.1 redoxin domain-containing protein [Candidatus Edwardsbacteria bacterium]MBU2593587.1 redoxin domain-containing protein [Candidatus Edwardsbacteria bacterium]